MSRLDKNSYYLEIAKQVALRSTCLDKQYGAVIVKNDVVIATGYNGSPSGDINCCDIGKCQSEGDKLKCIAVHAEENAILRAGLMSIGGILYLNGLNMDSTMLPCRKCRALIVNARIKEIVVPQKAINYAAATAKKGFNIRWKYISKHWRVGDFPAMDKV